MGCFVSDIEERMSARELAEWQEFYALDPFGPIRDNWHAALIGSILVNVNRKKGSPAAKVKDFMWEDSETKRQAKDAATLAWFDSKVKDG